MSAVTEVPKTDISPSTSPVLMANPGALNVPGFNFSAAAANGTAGKYGTLIPNRIFVGGLPSNATEQELKAYFSQFGVVKDTKIINDRSGMSRGVYGFVTFESQEVAENIIKTKSESLIFRDRKLNVGQAVRKQPLFPRPDIPGAVFFANGSMPLTLQNGGMTMIPFGGQEFLMPQAAYAPMVLPQPLYIPQPSPFFQQGLPSLPQNANIAVNQSASQVSGNTNGNLEQWNNNSGSGSLNAPANGLQTNGVLNAGQNANGILNGQQAWRWTASSTPQNPNAQGSTFLYSAYNNNELMYIPQGNNAVYQPQASGDYSTDNSNHSVFDTSETEVSPKRLFHDSITTNGTTDLLTLSSPTNNRLVMHPTFYNQQIRM